MEKPPAGSVLRKRLKIAAEDYCAANGRRISVMMSPRNIAGDLKIDGIMQPSIQYLSKQASPRSSLQKNDKGVESFWLDAKPSQSILVAIAEYAIPDEQ